MRSMLSRALCSVIWSQSSMRPVLRLSAYITVKTCWGAQPMHALTSTELVGRTCGAELDYGNMKSCSHSCQFIMDSLWQEHKG